MPSCRSNVAAWSNVNLKMTTSAQELLSLIVFIYRVRVNVESRRLADERVDELNSVFPC